MKEVRGVCGVGTEEVRGHPGDRTPPCVTPCVPRAGPAVEERPLWGGTVQAVLAEGPRAEPKEEQTPSLCTRSLGPPWPDPATLFICTVPPSPAPDYTS